MSSMEVSIAVIFSIFVSSFIGYRMGFEVGDYRATYRIGDICNARMKSLIAECKSALTYCSSNHSVCRR